MRKPILFLLILIFVSKISSRIYDINLNNFESDATVLSTFGYSANGYFEIKINSFKFHNTKPNYNIEEMKKKIGFILKPVDSNNLADLESLYRKTPNDCFLNHLKSNFFQIGVTNTTKQIISIPSSKFYALFFYHCENVVKLPISISIHVEEYNVYNNEKSYLSVGEEPLIWIYLIFSFLFSIISIIWIIYLFKHYNNVSKIHLLMTLLILLKSLTLLFESIRLFFIEKNGITYMWSILYYFFSFFKGITLFIVILLLGSGWSFLKPYLNEWEKRILLTVFSLQLISNLSVILIDQIAEGASNWLYYKSILLWIDVICCFLVLPVIAWSIRNLKNSKDEKSVSVAVRLNQFQQFYLIVIAYLYFTRVAIQFIRDSLPPNIEWMVEILREMASIGLFIFTGFRFKPTSPQKEEEYHI
eukprot:gene2848-4691_t